MIPDFQGRIDHSSPFLSETIVETHPGTTAAGTHAAGRVIDLCRIGLRGVNAIKGVN